MSENLSRQQIYDRIRATSKDSYILEEMKRLGFWETSEIPSIPEILINRESDATRELNNLLAQDRRYQNQEAMLKDMRKARMKKAKEKREETKQKNKAKTKEKAERWSHAQQHQLLYLGKDVSAGLNNTENDIHLLQKYNLPVFNNIDELLASMNIPIASLRFLLYRRKVYKNIHYRSFEISKKTGGKRKITAPKKRLKELQTWLLTTILNRIEVGEFVHGFVKERSIVTNAQPHLAQDIVINIDLKDFFPSIDYKRVKGLFQKLGYSEQLSTVFALIATYPETEKIELDGEYYYVEKGKRILPQGSPASPAISNMITYKLDRRLSSLAKALNFNYSRYADDLTFSAGKENEKKIAPLLRIVKKIVEAEDFTIHPEKTHVMRKGNRQKVTGLVVNEKINIERTKLRRFRALLHNIKTIGWKEQKWGKAVNLINAIEGYIQFIKMVQPETAAKFSANLAEIIQIHGFPPAKETAMNASVIKPEQSLIDNEKQQSDKEQHHADEGLHDTENGLRHTDKGQTTDTNKQEDSDWWNIFT